MKELTAYNEQKKERGIKNNFPDPSLYFFVTGKAERFITLVLREPFNYTYWQRNLYGDMGVKKLYDKVVASEKIMS